MHEARPQRRPPDNDVVPTTVTIAKRPDQTLGELQSELDTELSKATLCRALQKLRLTLKKKS
jgi:hypothetical protein